MTSLTSPNLHRRNPARHRAAAFIVALLVVTLLSGLVLVFARGMNASAGAARADVSQTQARWIARGAIEAIRGELAEKIELGEVPRLDVVGVQAELMGDGLYWVIGRNTGTGEPGVGAEEVAFGLVGEAGKINLNQAASSLNAANVDEDGELQSAVDQLTELPGMNTSLANAIENYLVSRVAVSEEDENDSEASQLYTVDELALVPNLTPDILGGEDLNRNGVLDPNEDDGDASPPADNADGRLDLGLREFVTVYSVERLTGDDGEARVHLNQGGQGLGPLLEEIATESRFDELVATIPPARPFSNLVDFFVRSELTEDEFAQLHDRVMIENADQEQVVGKIDIYQASAQVLDALAGFDPGDGATIVAARPVIEPGEEPGDFAWYAQVFDREKIGEVGEIFTHRSLQFSADVVAVSDDGKGFCRLRYVIDCEPVITGDAELPTVLYVQDLTSLGWPLDPAILRDLRQGASPEEINTTYGPTGSLGI